MDELIELPALWLFVLAPAIPWLAAMAVKPEGSNRARLYISAAASIALAIAETLTRDGGFAASDLFVAAVAAFGVQANSYSHVWKRLFDLNRRVLPAFGVLGGPDPAA